jgi:hypothetical protein
MARSRLRTNRLCRAGSQQQRDRLGVFSSGTSPNYFSGNVSIGTTTPKAKLDVAGAIRLSDTAQNCSHATDTGAIRYNSATHVLQLCVNGSGWSSIGSGGTPAGANTQIQFNSSGAFGADRNPVWDNTNKRLGIGTASPAAKLDVTGAIKLSDTAQNCSHATDTGALRFNSSTSKLHNTASTAQAGRTSATCRAEHSTSAQIQSPDSAQLPEDRRDGGILADPR